MLVTRMSYRILFDHQTALTGRIAQPGQTRSLAVLRSTQAFLRDRASHSISRSNRDCARFDLLFAEKPALTGGKPRKRNREWQQVEELPVLLLQVAGSG
jgi:hypothetical protein